ncbi:MAG: phenylalanine--tRNA ligase subunit alpha [Planctomycetes bacterium]|nr:phenylalanine--tRNA ligase subunit alpha [Planctomycetota bacterium]
MSAERARLEELALAAIAAARETAELARVEREFLGKEGAVGKLLASIRDVPPDERKAFGHGANELKRAIETALAARRAMLERERLAAERSAEDFDPSLPARALAHGSLHPLTHVVRRLEEIFSSMGYAILDGPEVELDYYNFEALNIPKDHPAREMHDTFWCDREQKLLLRTHTSPVQLRALERMRPPFRAIVPGRCFRNETTDASHEHTFHQMEGLVVGEDITVGHLIGTMKTFLREVFRRELEVRLRPGYFPFVEPGFELDVRCPFCERGCSVCKRSTWIELCPCGMVHPKVLRYGGVDPERYTGFAFGLGLSRLVMLRYGIDDIRLLMGADVRFLEQF